MEVDRNGLEVLPREECLRLLSKATVGRLGLTSGALPTVLPVNFCVQNERILVRTSPGSKLDAALAGNVVAFEADDYDALYHAGWSVVVTGRARVVDDPTELEEIAVAPLTRWAPLGEDNVISISTELVTGRRLGEAPKRFARAQPSRRPSHLPARG